MQAILDGAQQIAVPAFVSTLCICIVFVPMFFLTGVAKSLFVPLAVAVVFAMLASYLLSRTLVPTMVHVPPAQAITAKNRHGETTSFRAIQRGFDHGFERMRNATAGASTALPRSSPDVRRRAFSLFCLASLRRCRFCSGSDFFPTVDAGLIRLHVRARAGSASKRRRRESRQFDKLIRKVIPPSEIDSIARQHRRCSTAASTSRYSNAGVDRRIRRARS